MGSQRCRADKDNRGANEEWGVDNFRLFYTSALPVTFINFSGIPESTGNRLAWTTAAADNNSYYTIQRSTNGIDFKNIGTVAGTGNGGSRQLYSFIDNTAGTGLLYYRLKQAATNSNDAYSPVIRIKGYERPIAIKMFPNPLQDRLLVKTSFNTGVYPVIEFHDLLGKQINIPVANKNDGYECDLRSLKAGVYIVTVITGNGTCSQLLTKPN